MDDSKATLKPLLNSFENLLTCLDDVIDALAQHTTFVWLSDLPEDINLVTGRQAVMTAIGQLEYTDGQDPRETNLCPGLVGIHPSALSTIQAFNTAKTHFKDVMVSYRRHQKTNASALDERFRYVLDKQNHRIGTSAISRRLHLKQCYRHLPCLDKKPDTVGWTWANTRAITRLSVAQARSRLEKRAHLPHIASQLEKLYTLPEHEPLAIVQNLAPHLRMNIGFQTEAGLERLMLKGSLPLFFPYQSGETLPKFSPPKNKPASQSEPSRQDVKLSAEAFIPALRAHRYLKEPVES